MEISFVELLIMLISSVLAGIILLVIEYRTGWFQKKFGRTKDEDNNSRFDTLWNTTFKDLVHHPFRMLLFMFIYFALMAFFGLIMLLSNIR